MLIVCLFLESMMKRCVVSNRSQNRSCVMYAAMRMGHKAGLLLLGVFVAIWVPQPLLAQSSMRVSVSIPPLYSLVAGVMEGVGKPELLMAGLQSPHTQALTPSILRKINQSDLVVWVGPSYEFSLKKTLGGGMGDGLDNNLKDGAVLTAIQMDNLVHYGQRQTESADDHAHEHNHERAEGSDDDQQHFDLGYIDPHIWLSTDNAKEIVLQVGQRLSEADPANAGQYERNVTKILNRIDRLFADLSMQLANLEKRHYLVFHDAFQYFEKAFGLENMGVVALNAHRSPGARHLHELLERIQDLTNGTKNGLSNSSGSLCVFREPQFSSNALQVLVKEPGVKQGILDPLGVDFPLDKDHWFTLMENLAHGFAECLKS